MHQANMDEVLQHIAFSWGLDQQYTDIIRRVGGLRFRLDVSNLSAIHGALLYLYGKESYTFWLRVPNESTASLSPLRFILNPLLTDQDRSLRIRLVKDLLIKSTQKER